MLYNISINTLLTLQQLFLAHKRANSCINTAIKIDTKNMGPSNNKTKIIFKYTELQKINNLKKFSYNILLFVKYKLKK
jgi:hypothetical protein